MQLLRILFIVLCAIPTLVAGQTFTNPMVDGNCPDPWVTQHGDAYYWCRSVHGAELVIEKLDGPLPGVSKSLGKHVAYRSGKPPVQAHIWAPELYNINGKWYLYASAETNAKREIENLRMFVLESENWDGPYTFKAQLETPDWGIDPDILFHPNGTMYMAWSHFEPDPRFEKRVQELYIAPMLNCWTLDTKKTVRISTPEFDWEKKLGCINEGPQFLMKNNTVHLVYSASHCHGRYYCLGMLTASLDADLLDPKSWTKHQTPVFSEANSLYGPGHNCFVKSPDGREDWILYHAHQTAWEDNREHGDRGTYAQPFIWNGNTPVFGKPIKPGTEIPLPSGWSNASEKTYTNPAMDAADPCLLRKVSGDAVRYNGRYYLYHTGGGPNDHSFIAHSTDDFVEWKNEDVIFDGTDTWARSAYWAPEFYEIDGKYYGFFSAQSKDVLWTQEEHFNIGIIVADTPTGPFKPLMDRPIFEPGYPIIDANLFFDDDGTPYLTYSRCCYLHPVESELADWAREKGWYKKIEESWVYGVQLALDLQSIASEPVLLLRPPVKLDDKQAEWESRSVTTHEVNRRWTEGSTLFKRNSKYYITYSGNNFAGDYYAVGYATADHPLGPYTKAANNPIIEKNNHKNGNVRGTGHNNFFVVPETDEMFCIYHARTDGNNRRLFIDRMTLHEDGSLTIEGPTTTPQKTPIQ